MSREAVVLTGGASRRMGQDKASMLVDGESLAVRTTRLLIEAGWPVTVLGREPIEGASWLPDGEEFAGPLASLRRFAPAYENVFVCSCDIVRFHPVVPAALSTMLMQGDAAIPVVEGRDQSLCAVYSAKAFEVLRGREELTRVQDWVSLLRVVRVNEQLLGQCGIQPESVMGANTPEEFQRLSGKA